MTIKWQRPSHEGTNGAVSAKTIEEIKANAVRNLHKCPRSDRHEWINNKVPYLYAFAHSEAECLSILLPLLAESGDDEPQEKRVGEIERQYRGLENNPRYKLGEAITLLNGGASNGKLARSEVEKKPALKPTPREVPIYAIHGAQSDYDNIPFSKQTGDVVESMFRRQMDIISGGDPEAYICIEVRLRGEKRFFRCVKKAAEWKKIYEREADWIERFREHPFPKFPLYDTFTEEHSALAKIMIKASENDEKAEAVKKLDWYVCLQPTNANGRAKTSGDGAKANMLAFKHVLIEDDKSDLEAQLAAIEKLEQKAKCVRYVLYSGDKSWHAVCAVPPADEGKSLDQREYQFKEQFWAIQQLAAECGLNVDRSNNDVGRLSRLAGAPRFYGSEGEFDEPRIQTLLRWRADDDDRRVRVPTHPSEPASVRRQMGFEPLREAEGQNNDQKKHATKSKSKLKSAPKKSRKKGAGDEIDIDLEQQAIDEAVASGKKLVEYDRETMNWHSRLGHILGEERVYFSQTEDSKIVVEIGKQIGKSHAIENAELQADLTQYVMMYINVVAEDKDTGEPYLKQVPYKLTTQDGKECVVSARFRDKLPLLRRIIRRPLPSLVNGKIFTPKAGYNEETCEYYAPAADAGELIKMTRREAIDVIEDAIKEICFKNEIDQHAFVATMFDPFFDAFVPSTQRIDAPMIMAAGNQSGVGKDASRDFVAKIFGWVFRSVKIRRDKDEIDKIFGTLCRDGRHLMHIDESGRGAEALKVTQALRSYISGDMDARLLGKSQTIPTPRGFRFSMSAKTDIILDDDMLRRSFAYYLFTAKEARAKVWERDDWGSWVIQNAWNIYSALHSLVVEWVEAGGWQEAQEGKSVWAGQFSQWARFVNGCATFAGFDKAFETPPHERLKSLVGDIGGEDDGLLELCEHIAEEGKLGKWISRADLEAIVSELGKPIVIRDKKEEAAKDKTALCRILHNHANREHGDYRIVENDAKQARDRKYKVELIGDNSASSSSDGGSLEQAELVPKNTLRGV